jgi:hypothetical protein
MAGLVPWRQPTGKVSVASHGSREDVDARNKFAREGEAAS